MKKDYLTPNVSIEIYKLEDIFATSGNITPGELPLGDKDFVLDDSPI